MALRDCTVLVPGPSSSRSSNLKPGLLNADFETILSLSQNRPQYAPPISTVNARPYCSRPEDDSTILYSVDPHSAQPVGPMGPKNTHLTRPLPIRPLPIPLGPRRRKSASDVGSDSSTSTSPTPSTPVFKIERPSPKKVRSLPIPPPFPTLSPTTCTTPLRIPLFEDSDDEADSYALDWDLLDEILSRHAQVPPDGEAGHV